jgi:predicted ester cyclase
MPRTDTLLHRWFEEVWDKARLEAIDELMAADCVNHGLKDAQGNELRDRTSFKLLWHQFHNDFPDLHVELRETLVDEDRIAALCIATGTHSGSGKKVNFTGLVLARHKDGKFVESWNQYDFETMRQQLA